MDWDLREEERERERERVRGEGTEREEKRAEGEKRGELSEGINKRKRMKSIGRDVQESSKISFN